MAQHLSRSLLNICEIDATSNCCISSGSREFYAILSIYNLVFCMSMYVAKILQYSKHRFYHDAKINTYHVGELDWTEFAYPIYLLQYYLRWIMLHDGLCLNPRILPSLTFKWCWIVLGPTHFPKYDQTLIFLNDSWSVR